MVAPIATADIAIGPTFGYGALYFRVFFVLPLLGFSLAISYAHAVRPHFTTVFTALLVIVIAQLLLSIAISQGAYTLNGLQTKQTSLQRSLQAASEDLTRVSSPQNLAANANARIPLPSRRLRLVRAKDEGLVEDEGSHQ